MGLKYFDFDCELECKKPKCLIINSYDNYIGFSISYSKYKSKNKNFDHILINRKDIIEKLIPALKDKTTDNIFIPCICGDELLSIYTMDDMVCLILYDNYFLKHKRRKLSDSCILSFKESDMLSRALQVIVNDMNEV